MNEYHKIKTVFTRDLETKYKTLIDGEYAIPEFEYLKDCEWVFTEKVDGTNIRILWDHEKKTIDFKGKTERAEIPKFLYKKLQEIFPPHIFDEPFFDTSICLYGEGYGEKIQKTGGDYISDGVSFILFDVIIKGWWLSREKISGIADRLGIDIVPIIGVGTLPDMVNMVKSGITSQWGDFQAEGIVAKPKYELAGRNGSRIITKLKGKDFK